MMWCNEIGRNLTFFPPNKHINLSDSDSKHIHIKCNKLKFDHLLQASELTAICHAMPYKQACDRDDLAVTFHEYT